MENQTIPPANIETPSSTPNSIPTQTPPIPKKRSKLIYLFIAPLVLLILTVGATGAVYISKSLKPQPTPTQAVRIPTPTPPPAGGSSSQDTSNWKTYTNSSGMYQISYPNNYTLNVGKSTGVDGVIIQQDKSYIEIISPTIQGTSGNMKISINSGETNYKTPAEVAKTAGCGDISNKPGTPYVIDGTPALIFENTNCGPLGITQIDIVKNGRFYGISIEGTAPYETMKPVYEKILSTFKFTK